MPAVGDRRQGRIQARAQIGDYLRSSLSKHPLWAIKDPRMCLFAELWLDALASFPLSNPDLDDSLREMASSRPPSP